MFDKFDVDRICTYKFF